MGERGKKPEGREGPSNEPGLPFPCACLVNMADRVRDDVFVDSHRVVPWPHSASGCVPSFTGRWCGVPESRAMTLRGVDGEVTMRPSLWIM